MHRKTQKLTVTGNNTQLTAILQEITALQIYTTATKSAPKHDVR